VNDSSGTGLCGWSQTKGHKTIVVVLGIRLEQGVAKLVELAVLHLF